MKVIKYTCFFLVFYVAHGCESSIPNEDLTSYVLPPQDSELVYSLLDGGRMSTRVVSTKKEEVQLEDVMDIPKKMQLPEGMKWSDLGVKNRQIKYHYSFIFKKGHVLRRDRRDESILLISPLQPFASSWKVKMQNFTEGEKVESFGECQIVERKTQQVLGEERSVVTLDCIDKREGMGKVLFRHRFAKGVGIIEKSMYLSEDSSIKIDSTPPVQLIQLIEIRPKAN